MITFICALYSEAKNLIHTHHLKQNSSEHLYPLFEGEDIRLCITGTGMISAATCVSRHFSLYPPAAGDLVINLGIAGYTAGHDNTVATDLVPGTLFLASKITEQTTGRTFYPDLLYRHAFATLPVTTVSAPATDSSVFPEASLIDMEASALYQALLPYFTTERMFFFKIVSDVLDSGHTADAVTPAFAEQLVASHTDALVTFAKQLATHHSASSSITFSKEEELLKEELYKKLPLTESTRKEITRLFSYVKLTGCDLAPLLRKFLSAFPETPVRGKKQAAPYVKQLHDLVLDEAPFSFHPSSSKPQDVYIPFYHMIYAEKGCIGMLPDEWLQNHRKERIIEIEHYKDIFNRSRQNFAEQKKAPALILAKKTGTLIYEGAPVCQNFGNEHFYYTSCMMNCIYHCDYCYLQGMYPSGHTVVFVNLEDYFAELELLLQKHPVYLCVSYDTDLLALEGRFGFVKRWLSFAKSHPGLTLEIRTKSGNPAVFSELAALYENTDCPKDAKERIIFAWTVSPEAVIAATEHGAASLSLRLSALQAAKAAGFSVRLCFDPMIYHAGWKENYHSLVSSIFRFISPADLYDVSIGVFRISTDYLKNMRKKRPDSAIVQFPYITKDGVSHYGALSEEMVQYLKEQLLPHLPADKLFIWNGGT